jgi:hypothetical protein
MEVTSSQREYKKLSMEIQMVVRTTQCYKPDVNKNEHPAYPTNRTYFIFIRNNIIIVIINNTNNQQNHRFATDRNTEPLIYARTNYDKRIEMYLVNTITVPFSHTAAKYNNADNCHSFCCPMLLWIIQVCPNDGS